MMINDPFSKHSSDVHQICCSETAVSDLVTWQHFVLADSQGEKGGQLMLINAIINQDVLILCLKSFDNHFTFFAAT